jgi:sugar lactone lactonase YvrE
MIALQLRRDRETSVRPRRQSRPGRFRFRPEVGRLEERTLLSLLPTSTAVSTYIFGQSLTVTATVTSNLPGNGTPTGAVTFYDGNTPLGPARPLSNGTASLTAWMTTMGDHTITAGYSGNPTFATSTTGLITTAAQVPLGPPGGQGPQGVAVDASGDLFIADTDNHVVREVVKASGTTFIVAGNGTEGSSGDGGPAINAQLDEPCAVAVDGSGDLFIADYWRCVVREVVNPTGVIRTVAGDGTGGSSGNGGPATNAQLSGPRGVAVDAVGDLFIADFWNDEIREVVKASGLIIAVAGFTYPTSVAVDAEGDLFVADNFNSRTWEVVKATGVIRTVAGGPVEGVAVDRSGDVFIADGDSEIREVVAGTGTIVTVAGDGTPGYNGDGILATSAELGFPSGVAVDLSGDLFIADSTNDRIREVTVPAHVMVRPLLPVSLSSSVHSGVPGLTITLSATVNIDLTGTSAPPTGTITFRDGSATLGTVALSNGTASLTARMTTLGEHAITVSYSGDVNFAPAATGTITTAATAAASATGPGLAPEGVATDAAGDLFLADTPNNRIVELVKATGALVTVAGNGVAGYLGDDGPAISAELDGPTGVALDSAGDLFIADRGNDVIREVVQATGVIRTVAGDGTAGYFGDGGGATNAWLDGPTGVAVDGAGDLFIADTLSNRIREVLKTTGRIITVAGTGVAGFGGDGGSARAAALDRPERLAVDGSGDLFIADTLNNRIREVVQATGTIRTVAGDGAAGYSGDGGRATAAALDGPSDVAVDAAGDLFIADALNNRIREVDASGVIRTVAGRGTAGFGGDDQAAISAELSDPVGVALDGSGDLFIADTGNGRIREVMLAVPITVVRDATTTSLIASTSSIVYGQAVTFTAWVGISGPGVGLPTGTVTFYDGGTALGTVELAGSTQASLQATFTTHSLAVGKHAITAVYNGDADDNPSRSATVTVTVTSA